MKNFKELLKLCNDVQKMNWTLKDIFDVFEEMGGKPYGQCRKPPKGKLVNINEENNKV